MTQLNNYVNLNTYSAISENFNSLTKATSDINTQEPISYAIIADFQFYCIGFKNVYKVINTINTSNLNEQISEQLLNRNTSLIEISQYKSDQEAYNLANNLVQLNAYTSDDQEIVPAVSVTTGLNIVSYWS
jgi:hypothetical protein